MLTNDSVSSEKSGHFFKERQLIKINISFPVRGTAVPVDQILLNLTALIRKATMKMAEFLASENLALTIQSFAVNIQADLLTIRRWNIYIKQGPVVQSSVNS